MTEYITLIGDDATIEKIEFGTEMSGDGTKTFDVHAGGEGKGEGEWLITAKAETDSIFGSLAVGDLFPAAGTEIMAEGDKAKQVTATPFLDATSWSASFSAKEVETTRLVNKVQTYRKGKADAEGTVKGIFTLGVTGEANGLLNQFVRIIKKDASTVTVSEINSSPLYIRGVIRDTNKAGETYAFLFAQIELYGVNLGAESGNKQEYTSKFRFVADPIYYERVL